MKKGAAPIQPHGGRQTSTPENRCPVLFPCRSFPCLLSSCIATSAGAHSSNIIRPSPLAPFAFSAKSESIPPIPTLKTIFFSFTVGSVARPSTLDPHPWLARRAQSCPIVAGVHRIRPLRCSALDVGCSMFPGPRGAPRYLPWFLLSNRPEYRIGIPRRCNRNAPLSLSLQSSQELLKKQFDRIGNRMDHLMIVMAAGKTLVVSSDARGNEVVGCKKLVTRTGVQQPATKPKRQQLYFTHATPLEK